jgi:hypothetical protein
MSEEQGYAVIADATRRLEELRKALPDTTRGMFEFCIMLRIINTAMPRFAEWVRSESFLDAFVMWVGMGCPEVAPDGASEMLSAFKKGNWVN